MTNKTDSSARRLAIVTGASAGIGEATAVALAADGWDVVLAARRPEKLREVADRIARDAPEATSHVVEVDVTDRQSVDALASAVHDLGGADLLVNNAGGARGLDAVLDGDVEDWRWMYEANVIGTLQVTQSLFPELTRTAAPQVINVVSIAGRWGYRGGAGYNAAKFGETALTDVMRMEFAEKGVRVCQIDPGRVATDFSLNRFKGDEERAQQVYEDVLNLTAKDIAETIRWVADRPAHMDVDTIMIRPTDQA
ncbi:Putative short-chain type oxidoreductase [Corynebacterium glyciniphilum AJ 3170]|uniref:Putative short-chain type oxidoreductase n=1 Tax=Corynebacterium glyciniphilum AJ 3170 TaxID=1404245 RepID=X5E5E5_9CORY|nr:SDR family oxidoreductase [Corynebacterium glyciniphilum]AHW62695.1 Putative short-chain type oxidoreductase [Corynebacterium glyciniphilum AJ 3170]